MRQFSPKQLSEYITALHEAAHSFVAHTSTHWQIADPAVTFPPSSTGHLARAHFGPRLKRPTPPTKDEVREFVKIGWAGTHGQNLLEERVLLSVLDSVTAGCEDDEAAIELWLNNAGMEDEFNDLLEDSYRLVRQNAEAIFELADVIYASTGDVSRADVLKVLGPAPGPVQTTAPSPTGSSGSAGASLGFVGWLASLFKR
ncbi:hypothetical protein [Cupriavidus metallidurans]